MQQQLTALGYFNRPASTFVFLVIILLLFTLYFLVLNLVRLKKLTIANVKSLIIISVVILFFSYPAFSHDLFNYMFDARIMTKYHLNPYTYKALDFPADLWVRFMHWTHRIYPYGPIWLAITLPFSFLGLGKFVITLVNFKLMFALFHLGNIHIISKILEKISPKRVLYGVAFYAFNPLILIESLVSPHNEVVMLFLLLLSIYMIFVKKNLIAGIIFLVASAGVKFVTIVLLPLFLMSKWFKNLSKVNHTLNIVLILLIASIILEIYYREPYPWYFILLLGVAALQNDTKINILLTGVSIGTLLRYVPYLYQGSYTTWVTNTQNWIFFTTLVLSLAIILFDLLKRKNLKI